MQKSKPSISDARNSIKKNIAAIFRAMDYSAALETSVRIRRRGTGPPSVTSQAFSAPNPSTVKLDVISLENVALDAEVLEIIEDGAELPIGDAAARVATSILDIYHPGWRVEHEVVAEFRFDGVDYRVFLSLSLFQERNIEEVFEP